MRGFGWRMLLAGVLVAGTVAPVPTRADQAEAAADERSAAMLADLLRAARGVVARNQALINDPDKGDKGLSGAVVLAAALADYEQKTGADPADLPPGSRDARLMAALEQSIAEVVDEQQGTINKPGIGFKAFIPAVVGRLVSQKFNEKVPQLAQMRVTAPPDLVRNRKSRPDPWEQAVILSRFSAPDWPKGQPFAEMATVDGRPAYRVLAPEYYAASCLSCHGAPKGELDVTGYPKEGASEGQLGGAISITLYR